MKDFRKMRSIIIASAALCAVALGSVLFVSCNNDPVLPPAEGVRLQWVFEVEDDRNPTQFASGISEVHGWKYCPDGNFAQAFVLNEEYVFGQPDTGWHRLQTVDGVQRVVMEDARGFCPDLLWPHNRGQGELLRRRVPVLVETIGPHGEPVEAIRLWGTMMQRGSENPDVPPVSRTGQFNPRNNHLTPALPTFETDFRRTAGWPAVTLYATPPCLIEDPEQITQQALRGAYGFTFWTRSMVPFDTYRAAVENWSFRPDQGHEPGHWYGPRPGRDGTPGVNYTPAPVGVWTQVTVIYDPFHPGFNMDVPNWTTMFDIQANFPGDREPYEIMMTYNSAHSIRLVFNLHLQHNGGTEGTENELWAVTSGRHEFDWYFYGLELLTRE